MSALTGNQIRNSYTGLLKTTDNLPVTGTPKAMEDGAGNTIPMSIATGSIDFSGNIDFSAATVTGLPGGGGTTMGLSNTTKAIAPYETAGPGFQYRVTATAYTFGTSSFTLTAGRIYFYFIELAEGETIDKFALYITAADAGALDGIECGIFSAAINTTTGGIGIGSLLQSFGDVPVTTTGLKEITGIGYTLGSTYNNIYALAVLNKHTGGIIQQTQVSTTNLAGPIWHSSMYATTSYRGNLHYTGTGNTALSDYVDGETLTAGAAFPIWGIA